MKILLEGSEVPVSRTVVRESVFEYAASLTFTSLVPLAFETVTLSASEVETPYVAVRCEQMSKTAYQYTCYPKNYTDFLQKVTDPINITANIEDLLKALALTEFSVLQNSQPLHYVIPSLRGKSIIDFLCKYSKFDNGGCPTYHFGVAGGLIVSDLLSESLEEFKGTFTGTLDKVSVSLANQNKYAGKVNFHFFDEDTYTAHTSTFMQGAGISNLYRIAYTDAAKELAITEMQAKFWRSYFQGQLAQISNAIAAGVSPGVKVRAMDNEQEYIVVSSTATVENGMPNVVLELCRASTTEQEL